MRCKFGKSGFLLVGFLILGFGLLAQAQEHSGPVKVFVKDGKVVSAAPELAVDPTVAISIGHGGGFRWGLTVDGKRITCSPQGSIWLQAKIAEFVNSIVYRSEKRKALETISAKYEQQRKRQKVTHPPKQTVESVFFLG